MNLKIDDIEILGISCCVPKRKVDNLEVPGFDLEKKKKISDSIGVRFRRVTTGSECTSDLCLAAAENMLIKKNIDRHDIGVLVFLSQTPDYILPPTSSVLHDKLKLPKDVIAIDVNLGCSAFVYGLSLTSLWLKATDKPHGLLLTGDTISKCVSPNDASTVFLFGDAGSATLLGKSDKAGPMIFDLGTDGTGWSNLIIPAGGARCKLSSESKQQVTDKDGNTRGPEHLYMDGMEIFNFTISTIVPHIAKLIQEQGEPEAVVFHQANRFMLEFMRKSLKIPKDRFLYSLSEYGNTSSASIPLTLCTGFKNSDLGSNILLSGFGVGYSWGSVMLGLDKTNLLDVVDFGS